MGIFSFFKSKKSVTKNKPPKEYKGDVINLNVDIIDSDLWFHPKTETFVIDKLFVNPNEYFLPKQVIIILRPTIHGGGSINVKLPFSGKLEELCFEKSVKLNEPLFSIIKIEKNEQIEEKILEQNIEKLNKTEIGIVTDDFTNKKTIKFNFISNEETKYFKFYHSESSSIYEYFGMTFINHNGFPYISFLSTSKSLSLAKGDGIILLFESKESLEFVFNNASSGESGRKTNHIELTSKMLNTFLNEKILKIKVISKRRAVYDIYSVIHNCTYDSLHINQPQYSSKLEGQYLFNLMTKMYIKSNLDNKL